MDLAAPDAFELAARQFERQGAAKYYSDPVAFARDCIDWRDDQLTSYQVAILVGLVKKRKVAVRGPHGLGKTALMAIVVLWFALTRDAAGVDWKIVTTAGAWRQLEHYLWPEISKWAARIRWDVLGRVPLNGHTELLRLKLKLRSGEAFAAAASDPKKIEGAHADSLMYVFDESKAIIPETFDAAEGAFSGARPTGLPEAFALAFSTPGTPSGRFYEIHQQKPGYQDWWVRHVTADETIAAGRMSPQWRANRALQWGEGSALYHNRVLGEFYASDEDAVIPLSWIEAANERWQAWADAGRPSQHGRRVTGVDVARGGADLTVLAVRTGPVVTDLSVLRTADTMRIVDQVVAARATQTDLAVVDVIGVGAGVTDRLRRMNIPVIGFSAARGTKRMDRSGELGFVNLRSLMWWTLRQALDPTFSPTLALPDDPALVGQLAAPHWWLAPGNKIAVESKEQIAKRIGSSTDYADAVGHTLMAHADFDEPGHTNPVRPIQWGSTRTEHLDPDGVQSWGVDDSDQSFEDPSGSDWAAEVEDWNPDMTQEWGISE